MPAIICKRRVPKAKAYFKPNAMLCLNSSSRPGSAANPRSPAAQSPAGKLNKTFSN